MWQELLAQVQQGNSKALARCITLVENEHPGYEKLLQSLPASHSKIIGITGPPGAGKSTLVDALIGVFVGKGRKVAVVCVDPSSPFNLGAVLGDRIRMSDWYTHENVFIRSLATRGSMGGLHPKIIEIADLLKAFGFDYIIVETVGVGQSEVEIAGLADVTTVVVVPEAGDTNDESGVDGNSRPVCSKQGRPARCGYVCPQSPPDAGSFFQPENRRSSCYQNCSGAKRRDY